MLYWNLYQFLVQVSKLIAVTIPGEDSIVFTVKAEISLWCLFDSQEAVSPFILQKAKIWRFLFWFCPEASLLHAFIKALNTFERNFLIKKQSFLFVLSNFIPWTTSTASLGTALPGPFGRSVQPPAPTAPAAQRAASRAPPTWGHAGWWPSPCPANSVGCRWQD